MDGIPAPLRHERILDRVRTGGFVRVGELAPLLGTSEVTVRADLDAMAEAGLLSRVRGGAMPIAGAELPYDRSIETHAEEKARIGRAAADRIRSGDTVLLDVGSTAAAVARAIAARQALRDVTVVTNGLRIALALEPAVPRIGVVVTGGTLRPLQHSLVAPFADLLLPGLHADLAIIGCNGVDGTAGVTNINLPETELKRRFIAQAASTIVVADAAKLGRVHVGGVCPLDRVATLVTSAGDGIGPLRDAGLDVETV